VERLPYIDDARIRTPAAAREAARVAAAPEGFGDPAVFRAIQACAFRYDLTADDAWLARHCTLVEVVAKRHEFMPKYACKVLFEKGIKADPDELLSVCHLGFTQAIRYFNPFKGWKFVTFAMRVMINSGARLAKVERRNRLREPLQIDMGIDVEDGSREAEFDAMTIGELMVVLQTNSAALTQNEQIVIDAMFFQGRKLKSTGAILCLTKERARQIKNQALAKLRAAMDARL
jgi:RNA polymerase sigma factor (sigma-70 family)